jgi:hypothetical protein
MAFERPPQRPITIRRSFVAAFSATIALATFSAAPALGLTRLGGSGYWQAVATRSGAQTFCGIQTGTADGSRFSLVVSGYGLQFFARNPSWRLTTPSIAFEATIDGRTLSGTGIVENKGSVIRVDGIPPAFLNGMFRGNSLVLRIAAEHWNLSLRGSTAAGRLMQGCERAAGH